MRSPSQTWVGSLKITTESSDSTHRYFFILVTKIKMTDESNRLSNQQGINSMCMNLWARHLPLHYILWNKGEIPLPLQTRLLTHCANSGIWRPIMLIKGYIESVDNNTSTKPHESRTITQFSLAPSLPPWYNHSMTTVEGMDFDTSKGLQ